MPVADGEILPRSAELLASFAASQHAGGQQATVPGGTPLALAQRLARHHEEQWEAEDLCRAPAISDDVLGRMKRRIDELNGQRAELIDLLDQWVAGRPGQQPGAARHTETFGMMVDRMAIEWVRAQRFARDHAGQPRHRLARSQLAELAAAYDVLARDIAAGRRSLPAWRSLKFYQAPGGLERAAASGQRGNG